MIKSPHITKSLVIGSCILLGACTGLAPTQNELAALPLINYGDTLPQHNEFILRFPANTPLSVNSQVSGDIFSQTGRSSTQVQLKQAIYVYKNFASLDNQHWYPAHRLINSSINIGIPDKQSSQAGIITLEMNQKEHQAWQH